MKRASSIDQSSKTRPQQTASSPFHGRGAGPEPEDGAAVRLNRYLAQCGAGSRRGADRLIAAGRVTINGLAVSEPGVSVDPRTDRVAIDGKAAVAPRCFRYVMFHKPAGYLCSNGDPFGRPTIYDILPRQLRRLKYAGRLDADSEGLLLLTDDGGLIEKLTHPKHRIVRVYLARVRGPVTEGGLRPIENGIAFQGERYQPARVRILREHPDGTTLLEFRITEGKKREVRMMCRASGWHVIRLQRIAFGPLQLGQLPQGAVRDLRPGEAEQLGVLASLDQRKKPVR